MTGERQTDWEKIEAEYRAGQLSVREIARQHGVSHTLVNRKAKDEGWVRDLSAKVRQEVTARLVSADVSTDVSNPNVRDTVRLAAERGVEVVRQHRATFARMHKIAHALLDAVEAKVQGDTLNPAMALIGEKETTADVLEKVQRTVCKIVPLERQAFNLNGDSDEERGKVTEIHRVIVDPSRPA